MWWPEVLGGRSTKTTRGAEAVSAETGRGSNGVVKGIAVQGRMIVENRTRERASSRRARCGY